MPHAAEGTRQPRRRASRKSVPAGALAAMLACALGAAGPTAPAAAQAAGGEDVVAGILALVEELAGPAGTDRGAGEQAGTSLDLPPADDGQTAGTEQGRAADQATFPDTAATPAEALLREAISSFTTELGDLRGRGITVGELHSAIKAIERDPWCDLYAGCTWTYLNDGTTEDACTVTDIELRYNLTDEQIATYRQDWETALVQAAQAADGAGSAYEIVRTVHDYLATRCFFDGSPLPTGSTAYGALVLGQAGNRGFADAFVQILDRLGIEAIVVFSDEGVPWNMVRLDGAWYHVDVSWDAAPLGSEAPDVAPTTYFLVDDATMERAHGPWGTETPDVPAAPTSYGSLAAGTTTEEHVAFAKGLWRRAFDAFATELPGLGMYGLTVDEAYRAYDELVAEDPLYDYIDSHGCTYSDDGTVSTLTCTYRLTDEEFADYTARREEAVAAALAAASWAATPYEQVLAIHDYLVRTCRYGDPSAAVDHTAYSALLRGQAVCEGYAGAFAILMDRLGIPCATVRSEAMGHQWNMVQLDGQWYHVDATWDDPTPDQGPDAEVSHRFFLRGDDAMAADGHYDWSAPYTAPDDYPSV